MDSGKNDRKRGLESGSKDEDVENHKDSHKKLNLEIVIVAKHDIGDGWLASMLERPKRSPHPFVSSWSHHLQVVQNLSDNLSNMQKRPYSRWHE